MGGRFCMWSGSASPFRSDSGNSFLNQAGKRFQASGGSGRESNAAKRSPGTGRASARFQCSSAIPASAAQQNAASDIEPSAADAAASASGRFASIPAARIHPSQRNAAKRVLDMKRRSRDPIRFSRRNFAAAKRSAVPPFERTASSASLTNARQKLACARAIPPFFVVLIQGMALRQDFLGFRITAPSHGRRRAMCWDCP